MTESKIAEEMIFQAYKKMEKAYEYIRENNVNGWDASFVVDIKGLSSALLDGSEY